MYYESKHKLRSISRMDIRREIVELFLKEEPGKGSGEFSSKYVYCVEEFDNYKIVLQRPARLNKGFDFVVKVRDFYFKSGDGKRHADPSHLDICFLLREYKNRCPEVFENIKCVLEKIYNCLPVDIEKEISGMPTLINQDGMEFSPKLICYCAKWLFIEQDITYWNFSGRAMLWGYLQQEF